MLILISDPKLAFWLELIISGCSVNQRAYVSFVFGNTGRSVSNHCRRRCLTIPVQTQTQPRQPPPCRVSQLSKTPVVSDWWISSRRCSDDEARAVLSSCLPHTCSICLFLLLFVSCAAHLCVVATLILSQCHHVPTVCKAVFTHHIVRLLCIACQFQSVTFPHEPCSHCVPSRLPWKTGLVMLQGLQCGLTTKEFLHSYRWDYVIRYSVENELVGCKCIVQLITMHFNKKPLTICLNSSD